MKWTWEELGQAELKFSTDRDQYKFVLPGKRLVVPGYFVGDPELVTEMQRAAEVVRNRLPDELRKRGDQPKKSGELL